MLDRFRKNDVNSQKREQIPRQKTEYTRDSLDGKNEILLYGVSNQGQIKHRNQEITKLIMARITKYREGDTIFFDASDYISFELPIGQEVTEEIMQSVMEQYDKQDMQEKRKSHYLGRLEQIQGKTEFGNRSKAVEKIVQDIINRNEKIRQEQIQANIREKEQNKVEFREQIARSVSSHEEYMKRVREQRKANPAITYKGTYKINGKNYMDYDGIDLVGGDVLRIRKVDKIGKDGSGTYLYSAYLNKTPNEYDVEFLSEEEPAGYPVCFTLEKRLEDIVREGKTQEINTLLSLLSNSRNFENNEQLVYIGGINRNGKIIDPASIDNMVHKIRDYQLQLE